MHALQTITINYLINIKKNNESNNISFIYSHVQSAKGNNTKECDNSSI